MNVQRIKDKERVIKPLINSNRDYSLIIYPEDESATIRKTFKLFKELENDLGNIFNVNRTLFCTANTYDQLTQGKLPLKKLTLKGVKLALFEDTSRNRLEDFSAVNIKALEHSQESLL